MNLLDGILIILLIGSIVRGAHVGAMRQFFLLLGLVAGLYASILLVPYIAPYVSSTSGKTLIGLVIFSILAVIFGGVFEMIGMSQFEFHQKSSRLPLLNSILGAGLGILLMSVSIWLVAAAFDFGPSKWLADELHHAAVVRTINRLAPAQPPQISRVQQFLSQVKLPQAFIGPEPNTAPLTNPIIPTNFNALVVQEGPSVVKITGYGCGGILEGSGFIAQDHLVVTNAHVVAGVSRPAVHDQGGSHSASVIYFDPNLDIAILRVNGLRAAPLSLDTTRLSRGVTGAVMGYPQGGNFSAVNAAILSEVTAVGRNIYNSGSVHRRVYILAADVEPGNSGGPFIEASGQVGGVVFARSEDQANTGFALTADQIQPVLDSISPGTAPVGTGSCAAG